MAACVLTFRVAADGAMKDFFEALGPEAADLLVSRWTRWMYRAMTDPALRGVCAASSAGPAPSGEAAAACAQPPRDPDAEDPDQGPDHARRQRDFRDMLAFVQDTLSGRLDAVSSRVEALVGTATQQRYAESQHALLAERNRSEELARASRVLTAQVEERSRELEKVQGALALMQRQANARGIYGETMIEGILAAYFTGAEIVNVGLNGKSEGDLHVRVDAEGHLVSVECKCSKRLGVAHVNKTVEHARNLKRKHGDKYLGHLFVSLEYPNIPDKGCMHVEYDAVPGATLAWVGLEQLQGNERAVLHMFDTIVKSQAIHQTLRALADRGADSDAYQALLKDLRDMAGRLCAEMETYVSTVRDFQDHMRTSERIADGLRRMLRYRWKEYQRLSQMVGQTFVLQVAGKREEAILRAVVGPEVVCCSAPGARDQQHHKDNIKDNNNKNGSTRGYKDTGDRDQDPSNQGSGTLTPTTPDGSLLAALAPDAGGGGAAAAEPAMHADAVPPHGGGPGSGSDSKPAPKRSRQQRPPSATTVPRAPRPRKRPAPAAVALDAAAGAAGKQEQEQEQEQEQHGGGEGGLGKEAAPFAPLAPAVKVQRRGPGRRRDASTLISTAEQLQGAAGGAGLLLFA
jgi:hypothetical protein